MGSKFPRHSGAGESPWPGDPLLVEERDAEPKLQALHTRAKLCGWLGGRCGLGCEEPDSRAGALASVAGVHPVP